MLQSIGACFPCRSSAVLYCFVGFADREVQGVSGIPGRRGGGSLSLPLHAGRRGRILLCFSLQRGILWPMEGCEFEKPHA